MFCVIKVIKGYCDVLDTKDGVVERVPQTFLKKRIVGVEGVCATSICALSNQDILDRQISVNKLMQVTLPIIEITVIVDTVLAKCMVKDVVSVDVPYGITSIGFADEKKREDNGFSFCEKLVQVCLPNSVKYITAFAFYGCKSLKVFNTPIYLKSIGEYAFCLCTFTEFFLPNTVTKLGQGCFKQTCLQKIEIPPSIKALPASCFEYCMSLCDVKLSDNIKTLGCYCFCKCCSLEFIRLPESLLTVHSNAFEACENLKVVVFNANLTIIGMRAFFGCVKLQSIQLGSCVQQIDALAFGDCKSVRNVFLPDSVRQLGDAVFRGCSSLEFVRLPNNLEFLPRNLFADCIKLKSVCLPLSLTILGANVFKNCKSLETLELPEGVRIIESFAFYGCSNLKEVYIPESVTTIGDCIFSVGIDTIGKNLTVKCKQGYVSSYLEKNFPSINIIRY